MYRAHGDIMILSKFHNIENTSMMYKKNFKQSNENGKLSNKSEWTHDIKDFADFCISNPGKKNENWW